MTNKVCVSKDIDLSISLQYASSMNMNPNKWMLVNFDCSLMWVRDRFLLTQALVVDPLYLQHSYSESAIDYRVSLFLCKRQCSVHVGCSLSHP